MGYFTSLHSKKMSSPDNPNHCWGSQLEALSKWLRANFAGLLAQGYKEQSFCWATQGFHLNQSLQKSILYIYNKFKLSSGPRDLWALLIPLHINYQATPFGHQYFLQWNFLFEPDISAQVLIWKQTVIQHLPYWVFSDKTHCFPQLHWFCDTFWT